MVKVVVVGDRLVSSETLKEAALQLTIGAEIEVMEFNWHADLTKDQFQEKILQIEKGGPEAVQVPEGIVEAMADADYLLVHIAPVSKEMLANASQLKMIGTCRGGLEHVAVDSVKEKNIPLIHVIRNAEPVADFTVGLIYAETRNIARGHRDAMTGKWTKAFPNDPYKTTIDQLKVGLIGLGYIGKLVVKRLNALGVEVMAYDPFVDPERIKKEGLSVEFKELEEVFSEADVLSLHMRVTPETTNMVSDHLISLMKPSAYLINTARAAVLDKNALITALKEKRIAGAALDVIWKEPIEMDDPLLQLNNVTLTPHIAGDTIDAIPKSPYLLRDVINAYLKNGISDMLIKL
ncbi:2-hydroxyacid dehydrogenase [Enterococcus sp. BWB1-3]|uniref:2-hydroxyacid dehydrogenase n=1 Tax=unclassified Enterococcus TaxID=2608891 RepID=UPI001924358F|nr:MULTISPECIES: 2-hydroxyacid dehydrogenase [unclassified Enterococcus]MBL1228473.1 2-hydroxyacid dehydrogenase [Enterococcus sp. BWB1-3]MCB5950478.1 2-hydroxyacid dehydrogenase [Enterococcus sp. BWT-B8]